jgi:hypothetical protein
MADMLAQVWLWIANAFEDRSVLTIVIALAFAVLIGSAIAVLGA